MTFSERLRAYVAAHPGATGAQVAAGLGEDKKRVVSRLTNMVRHQIMRTDGNSPRGFSIRRELIRRQDRTPEETRARYLAYQREYEQRRKAARNTARVITAATVEDFLAQGGHIDSLPGFRYVLPQQLPLGEIA